MRLVWVSVERDRRAGPLTASSIPAKVVHLPRETLIRLPSAESADVSRLRDSECLLQSALGSTETVSVCVLAGAVWLQENKNGKNRL